MSASQSAYSSAAVEPEVASELPPLPADATPEQKDEHWFRHVYQGNRMPQLTLRAVLMGGVLGMLMSASNLYTTLKIGWSFGVAITSCVISYVVWNAIRGVTGASKMSILENNCMQSTASAAGASTGSTIGVMFGALLLMETGDSAAIRTWMVQNVWIVAGFTLCTACLGVFLAIPMKKQMINHEQLPFPSGIAAASTLRSLYSQSREAIHKAYALICGLVLGAVVGILNTGEDTLAFIDRAHNAIKGMLGFTVRLPELVPEKGFFQVNNKSLIQFGFEPSVLLIAAGMIVGMRVSLSMLAGSALLYFVVAPYLIGLDTPYLNAAGTGFKPDYVANIELTGGGTIYHVYRWGLWAGTALMVFTSLTALALQWKTVARAFTGVFKSPEGEGQGRTAGMADIEVPMSWMVIGMIPITIGMVVVQMVGFSIAWWAGLIAVGMAFILSLVACRATGETDTTPIGAMGKVMQLLFAVLPPTRGLIVPNLASAGIAANSASSSADLLTDLKSGYLLGANPRKQFLAQFFGVFFGVIAVVPVWFLMVPTKAALEKYPAPATNQWYRVAQVLTKGLDSLPDSAKWAILVGSIIGIALPVIEKTVLPAKFKPYFPSAMGLGLSWVVGFNNALAFALGALISLVWKAVSEKKWEVFNVPLASGLIAGESLMKAAVAMTATVIGLLSSTPAAAPATQPAATAPAAQTAPDNPAAIAPGSSLQPATSPGS